MPEAAKHSNPGWTIVAFGDVVRQVKDLVDPEQSGLQRYVAGEHMDSEDFRLRRWGTIGDGYLGPAFHMRFKPGHVLYGSRRTYLRKVAVADFEGITANTTYVLEAADPQVLLPELLPFIMQTEAFTQHSVRESKGSVNPYVNFSDLAWFEFALPPIEEQRRFAAALKATWCCKDELSNVATSARALRAAFLEEYLRGRQYGRLRRHPILGQVHREWPVVPLSDLLDACQYGLSNPLSECGRYPVLRMMNLSDGLVVPNDLKYLDLPDAEARKYILQRGDVLFNRTNSYDLVGRTAMHQLDGEFLFASYLVRIVPNSSRLLPSYLVEYLNSGFGRTQVMSFASRGVSQTNVSASNLEKVLLPLPSLPEQEQICRVIAEMRRVEADALGRSRQVSEMCRMMQALTSGATP